MTQALESLIYNVPRNFEAGNVETYAKEIGAVNKKRRIIEIDYLKFLAIFFMIIVHVLEEMCVSDPSEVLPTNNFQFILNFLLMMCTDCFVVTIGLGFGFSSNKSWEAIAKRGWHLIVLGYVLNFLRGALPYIISCIIDGEFEWIMLLNHLLNVDLLHMAGVSYLLLSLFTKFKASRFLLMIVALLMQAAGTALQNIEIENQVLKLLLAHFIPSDVSFFPILSSFIYIVAGIFLADFIKKATEPDRFYLRMIILSLVGILSLIVESSVRELGVWDTYFLYCFTAEGLLVFLFDMLTVMLFISALHFIHKLIRSKRTDNYVIKTSKNLNTIYLIHWIIIGWCTTLFHVPEMSYGLSVLVGFVLAWVCILVTNALPSFNFAK